MLPPPLTLASLYAMNELTWAAHDFEAFANVLSGVKSLNVVFADILLGVVDYLTIND